jgi:hypothetical protein
MKNRVRKGKTIRKRGVKRGKTKRRVRHRGGMGETGLRGIIKKCKSGETNDVCLKRILDELELHRVDQPPDGNCFFHSIATFMKNRDSGYPDNLHSRLRKAMYEYFKSTEGREKYEPFVENYNKEVEEFKRDKYWSSQLNDIVVNAMADYFNMEIHIFNFDTSKRPSELFEYVIEPNAFNNAKNNRMIINLLRTGNNHFDLLFNIDDAYTYFVSNINYPINMASALK